MCRWPGVKTQRLEKLLPWDSVKENSQDNKDRLCSKERRDSTCGIAKEVSGQLKSMEKQKDDGEKYETICSSNCSSLLGMRI
jgi:hypothetical protein